MAKLFKLLSSGLVVAEKHKCILEGEVILRVGEVRCSSMEEEETSQVEVGSGNSMEVVETSQVEVESDNSME
ncbi:hypothetical protein D8763_20490, partial [Proteus mirabilis]|nr:hypothetical protein [Proteus mirabilis]